MRLDERVEEYLALNGPASAPDIQEALQVSQPHLSRVLQGLTNAGIVQVFSFSQKLYSTKRKPLTLQALLNTQLCAIARMAGAYDHSVRNIGQVETDRKLIEALRTEMHRWNTVINDHEDKLNDALHD